METSCKILYFTLCRWEVVANLYFITSKTLIKKVKRFNKSLIKKYSKENRSMCALLCTHIHHLMTPLWKITAKFMPSIQFFEINRIQIDFNLAFFFFFSFFFLFFSFEFASIKENQTHYSGTWENLETRKSSQIVLKYRHFEYWFSFESRKILVEARVMTCKQTFKWTNMI